MLFAGFVSVRVPYFWGGVWFVIAFTVRMVLSMFFSVALKRMRNIEWFLARFVCEGVPWLFGLFSRGVEMVSWLIRPVLTILRPLVNLLVGLYVSHVTSGLVGYWLLGESCPSVSQFI